MADHTITYSVHLTLRKDGKGCLSVFDGKSTFAANTEKLPEGTIAAIRRAVEEARKGGE